MAADRIGQVIGGRFRIEAMVGHGAMARVYRARDVVDDGEVAVKIMRGELRDPSTMARFAREAAVQARIDHPNVAKLIGTGMTEAAEPYIAVEMLHGHTLRDALKRGGPLAPARAASFAWQALQGLAAVLRTGVLPRDLKPANMMLVPGAEGGERVVLIDFGFASLEGAAKLTGPLMVVGSLRYIAPERLRDVIPDGRADLYAIGAILFELVTGAPPFTGDDMELADAHLNDLPHSDPAIPPALAPVIMRALAKDPDDRYADADAMALAIDLAARRLH